MRAAHEITAWLLIGFNAVAGRCAWRRTGGRRLRGRWLWALVIVAQSLVFVQATLGTILARRGTPSSATCTRSTASRRSSP